MAGPTYSLNKRHPINLKYFVQHVSTINDSRQMFVTNKGMLSALVFFIKWFIVLLMFIRPDSSRQYPTNKKIEEWVRVDLVYIFNQQCFAKITKFYLDERRDWWFFFRFNLNKLTRYYLKKDNLKMCIIQIKYSKMTYSNFEFAFQNKTSDSKEDFQLVQFFSYISELKDS